MFFGNYGGESERNRVKQNEGFASPLFKSSGMTGGFQSFGSNPNHSSDFMNTLVSPMIGSHKGLRFSPCASPMIGHTQELGVPAYLGSASKQLLSTPDSPMNNFSSFTHPIRGK